MIKNRDVLNTVFKGTNAYQLGVPDPTQSGIAASYKWLMNPNNNEWRRNTFIPGLINLFGTQILRTNEWKNPLAEPFKRVSAPDNKAIEEMMVRLIMARAYTPKAQGNLLEYNPPEVEVRIHTVNRKDFYPITVNDYEIRPAMLKEGGLSEFVAGCLEAPRTSDNRDEYLIMKDCIAKYENEFGFYTVECDTLAGGLNTKEDVDNFIIKIQEYAALLTILKPCFNPDGMETFTLPENLVLITTPDIYAKINVKSLAQAFNVEYAKIRQRVVIVDEIPVDDCYGLLLDERWFMCGDSVIESTSFFNPATLQNNYWLHHWGVYSYSTMVNALALRPSRHEVSMSTVTPTTYKVELYNEDGTEKGNNKISVSRPTYVKGKLGWTAAPAVEDFPADFAPSVFTVTEVKTPDIQEAATAEIIQPADITGPLNVDAATFGKKVKESGVYYVSFNGKSWVYEVNGEEKTDTLDSLGITGGKTGSLSAGDTIVVTYTAADASHTVDNCAATYVDNFGKIHLADEIDGAGWSITIEGKSTYTTDGFRRPGLETEYKESITYTTEA